MLEQHAKMELELAGMFDKDSDYDGMLGDAVMELVKCFAKQGHSGCSAAMTLALFQKVASFKPLTPITFKDEEWVDTGNDAFQNKRNSAVFKKGKDGRPYYIDAHYQKTQTGSTWGGSISVGDGRVVRKCYIKDPANMPKICIDVIDWEVNKDTGTVEVGSGWWLHKMKDVTQLQKLEEFYDIEYTEDEGESK